MVVSPARANDLVRCSQLFFNNAQGYFRILALPVGSYNVKLSHTAHQGVIYENVSIRLGKTTTLGEVRLQPRTVEMPEVVVSGERPLIDPTSTTAGTNLSSSTYETLPMDRNFRSIASLASQANTSYFGDEVNISGSTGIENLYVIDGINVTDIYRATTSTNLPYNFVKEVEVKTGGYEAEYGRALGGILNVITPSGGNEFHGQGFGFFTDNRLSGKQRPGIVKESVSAFSSYDVGLSLSGPLVRDKLWFFTAYNPNFEDKDVEIPGLGIHRDRKRSHLFSGKLTWQADANTNLVLTALGDPSQHHKVGNPGLGLATPNKLNNADPFLEYFKEGGIDLSLKGSRRVSEHGLFEASVSRFDRRSKRMAETDRGGTEPLFIDYEANTWSGGFAVFEDPHTIRTATQFNGSFFLKRHTLKAGFEYEDNFLDLNFHFGDGRVGWVFRNSSTSYGTFYFLNSAKVRNRIPSMFAQDSWLATDRLRLNAGLRWDGQYLVGSDGKVAQRITDQFQPGVGFTYQSGEL